MVVGMMGSGKTTVGRALAERLHRPFLDSDAQVEALTGRTVAEIWRTDGEAAFRRLESRVLADALSSPEPNVVAAAGGVVVDPTNRRLLQGADHVVWLRAEPETLAGRVGNSSHRPLLDDDPEGVLRRLAREREPLYREVADEVVDIDHLTPEQVVDRIWEALR